MKKTELMVIKKQAVTGHRPSEWRKTVLEAKVHSRLQRRSSGFDVSQLLVINQMYTIS